MVRSLFAVSLLIFPNVVRAQPEPTPDFQVRRGYIISIASPVLEEARFMDFDDRGTLFVSQPGTGKILALRDTDSDGVYEAISEFVSGHPTVHGLDWHDGWLWFTQSGAVHRARDTTGDGVADEIVTVIPDGQLPKGGGHWWRSICVTPTHFFTSIGDSANISDESDTDRQKIWRFDLDGSNKTLWSSGIRNTEKLRLRPGTDELWGADHGSDWFGLPYGERQGQQPITDLLPPEEFNHYIQGGFYGHPFIVGKRIPRLEFVQSLPKERIIELAEMTIPPAYEGGSHWANNGFTFLESDHFNNHPDGSHTGDAFIAYHGSWNSSVPVGYQVHRVLFDDVTGRPMGGLTVVSTINRRGQVVGRPVDCVEAPDGSILFSCSRTKRIYRIRAE
jgi:glucose/arabinose dehydrogenase